WTSTPQVRGTADLLISCLTTLFLCAWTAYHPNVHRRRSEWHNFGHRIIWMSIAVLVPEVVLFCAWEQWGEARRLRASVNNVAPETWSMEQAHFALSGGFAISSSAFSPHSTLTFTPSGVKFLAKLGLLPRISHDSVVDKSKADWIAKVLVCVQASWFFVQCIARVSQKLPLTLLELHVLTHVVCAFGMYVLWWGKPYDVGTPVL
ncbi:hypothetical protein P154DRAFT_379750, partial [Amniculicola lignicola CBS 123094]